MTTSRCRAILCASVMLVLFRGELAAQTTVQETCDLRALQATESEFLRLVKVRRDSPGAVTDEGFRQASTNYVETANRCYEALYGQSVEYIDDGGLLFDALRRAAIPPRGKEVGSRNTVSVWSKCGGTGNRRRDRDLQLHAERNQLYV